MKKTFSIFTILFLTCNQFVSIHAWPFPEVNMLYDATFSKLQRSLAKSAYGSVDHKDIYLDIFTTVVKCLYKPKELICESHDENMNGCIKPLKMIVEKAAGTKYENIIKMIFKTMISLKEFVCNAKFKDLIEIMNPCLELNKKTLLICWQETSDKFINRQEFDYTKEEYCDPLQRNAECTLTVLTKNCNNPLTRKSIAGIYNALFIRPCLM